jgi:ATP-dependent Clp protease ATP-binding subunit ClpA
MSRIFDRMLDEANEQYLTYGIKVMASEAAKDHILHRGYNPTFGARPLRSRMLKDIDAPLADLLASGGIPQGSRVLIVYNGGDTYGEELSFYYERDSELESLGRKRREAVQQSAKRSAPQETKAPAPSQGPAMAKTIENMGRR